MKHLEAIKVVAAFLAFSRSVPVALKELPTTRNKVQTAHFYSSRPIATSLSPFSKTLTQVQTDFLHTTANDKVSICSLCHVEEQLRNEWEYDDYNTHTRADAVARQPFTAVYAHRLLRSSQATLLVCTNRNLTAVAILPHNHSIEMISFPKRWPGCWAAIHPIERYFRDPTRRRGV